MQDIPLTFEDFEEQVEAILGRSDYYSFLIENAVRVKRQETKPFGDSLWIQGVSSYPTEEQMAWFSKVRQKVDDVHDAWHLRDKPECPCHEAKRLRGN